MALVLLGAGRARAESPVGLDARGVDPMAAVDNGQGLDVRDALGRRVSAQVVLAELKRAQVARTAETAYESALPKAASVLPSLEAALGRVLSLVGLTAAPPGPAAWASLPARRPRLSAPIFRALGAVAARAAPASWPRASLPPLSSCRRGLEVLRC